MNWEAHTEWLKSKSAKWKYLDPAVKARARARSEADFYNKPVAKDLSCPRSSSASACFMRSFIDEVGDANTPIRADLFMAAAKAHVGADVASHDIGFTTFAGPLRRDQLAEMVVHEGGSRLFC